LLQWPDIELIRDTEYYDPKNSENLFEEVPIGYSEFGGPETCIYIE
jgi:hypothetical protein